jgi:hypothetical protein
LNASPEDIVRLSLEMFFFKLVVIICNIVEMAHNFVLVLFKQCLFQYTQSFDVKDTCHVVRNTGDGMDWLRQKNLYAQKLLAVGE